jgi:hypothetical protein
MSSTRPRASAISLASRGSVKKKRRESESERPRAGGPARASPRARRRRAALGEGRGCAPTPRPTAVRSRTRTRYGSHLRFLTRILRSTSQRSRLTRDTARVPVYRSVGRRARGSSTMHGAAENEEARNPCIEGRVTAIVEPRCPLHKRPSTFHRAAMPRAQHPVQPTPRLKCG